MLRGGYQRKLDDIEEEKQQLYADLWTLSKKKKFRLRIDAGRIWIAPMNGIDLDVSWERVTPEKARRIVKAEKVVVELPATRCGVDRVKKRPLQKLKA